MKMDHFELSLLGVSLFPTQLEVLTVRQSFVWLLKATAVCVDTIFKITDLQGGSDSSVSKCLLQLHEDPRKVSRIHIKILGKLKGLRSQQQGSLLQSQASLVGELQVNKKTISKEVGVIPAVDT